MLRVNCGNWRVMIVTYKPNIKHFNDVIMNAMASQTTGVSIVYSTVCWSVDKKKTAKLHVTGLCEGNSPMTGEFPAQRASNAENAFIRWRHHGFFLYMMGQLTNDLIIIRRVMKWDSRGNSFLKVTDNWSVAASWTRKINMPRYEFIIPQCCSQFFVTMMVLYMWIIHYFPRHRRWKWYRIGLVHSFVCPSITFGVYAHCLG